VIQIDCVDVRDLQWKVLRDAQSCHEWALDVRGDFRVHVACEDVVAVAQVEEHHRVGVVDKMKFGVV